MTTAHPIAPETALGWLRSLSVDIRAAAILNASGDVVAGDRSLAGAGDPGLLVVRSDRHAIALRVGPKALTGLLRADARAALEALDANGA